VTFVAAEAAFPRSRAKAPRATNLKTTLAIGLFLAGVAALPATKLPENSARAAIPAVTAAFFDPVHQFREQSDDVRHLVEQANDDVYFVVASAYDYDRATRGERVLMWRTRMTVNTLGVSMRQTLPPLIATASPFLGRETAAAVPISKRAVSEGEVELGELQVIGVVEDEPSPDADGTAAQTGSAPPPTAVGK